MRHSQTLGAVLVLTEGDPTCTLPGSVQVGDPV